MGAILCEAGAPEAGEQHFKKALELGSSERAQDWQLRNALERSTPEERNRTIEYLLSANPQRYEWLSRLSAMQAEGASENTADIDAS